MSLASSIPSVLLQTLRSHTQAEGQVAYGDPKLREIWKYLACLGPRNSSFP